MNGVKINCTFFISVSVFFCASQFFVVLPLSLIIAVNGQMTLRMWILIPTDSSIDG